MYLDKEKKAEIFGKYGKGTTDTGSAEAQIALFTYRIAHLTEHVKANHKDFVTTRSLTQLVGKRRRLLTYLKEHIDAMGREIIRRDREEELEFLLIGCQLEPTHLDQLLACAEGQSSPVLVSRILEQKRRLLPSGADKVFDL